MVLTRIHFFCDEAAGEQGNYQSQFPFQKENIQKQQSPGRVKILPIKYKNGQMINFQNMGEIKVAANSQ